jgi:hypothetical protein
VVNETTESTAIIILLPTILPVISTMADELSESDRGL